VSSAALRIAAPLKRRALLAGAALAAALALAAPASAAVRNASPSGAGVEPCNPAPCSLSKAVTGAKAGDQVVLAPGTYKLNADLVLDKAIDVGGVPGGLPRIEFLNGHAAFVQSDGAVLHDVHLSLLEEAMAYVFSLDRGRVERVYADGTNTAGCQMTQGLLRDSVCLSGLQVAPSGVGSYRADLVNVTADPIMVGAFEGAALTANIVNSILLPDEGDAAGLLIDVSAGSSATAVLTNSNYAAVDTSLSAGTSFTYTAPGTNGNQTAVPQFVDRASGDFRPLAGSPTVDAGTADALLGAYDVLGAARSQARCIGGVPVPDIGAYEFAPTVACPSTPLPPAAQPSTPLPWGIGKLTRNPAKGTATLPVTVAGAGVVGLSGKGIVTRTATTRGARTVKLVVKAKGAKLAKLRRTGKVKLRPAITFTPSGGAPVTVTKRLTLKFKLSGE